MRQNKYIVFNLLIASILSACTSILLPAAPTPNLWATEQSLKLQQTQIVLETTVQAQQAAETQAALATPTLSPSATPLPPPTPTPGPVVIQDDFSTNTGRWLECGQCIIENGVMRMGPYPVSITGEAYTAICKDCGEAQDYKMGIDATFVDGYTDRSFGLLLREVGGNYIDIEITTWQVYGVWSYDKQLNNWGGFFSGGWVPTGNLRPGVATNRVEVDVTSSEGTSTINIYINGQLANTATMPAISGQVGLVVGLHSLGVAFDNFYLVVGLHSLGVAFDNFYFEGYLTGDAENEGEPSQQG